jgi:response regulator RpfG family c-di-GMP phosphodiesterase
MLAQHSERSVLVVDDEDRVRNLIAHWLTSGGYSVHEATTAEEALAVVDREPAAVALCDIRLPGHDGIWLADHLREAYPETAIIMATAAQGVWPSATSPRRGVLDYLMKPFGRDRLREAVARGVAWHCAAVDSRRRRETLAEESSALFAQLAHAMASLKVDTAETLDAVVSILNLRDRDAYAHAYRVVGLAVSVARLLDLSDAEVSTVERAALIHDVGKFAMPEALLRKPAALTVEEHDLVRTHPQLGHELVRGVPFLADAAEFIWASCERIDGLGYPRGLHGGEIPFGSLIIGVAEAYGSMTRLRAFREAMSPREAVLEIERCVGTQFDRRVVDAFRRVVTIH